MARESFSGSELPPRINVEGLNAELRSVAPRATAYYRAAVNWTRVDPESGEEAIEREGAALVVEGLPEGVGRGAVLAVLAGHDPEESDEERAARARPSALADRVAALEGRLEALEGKKGV